MNDNDHTTSINHCSPPGQEIISAPPLVVARPSTAAAWAVLAKAGRGDLIDDGVAAGPRGGRGPGEGRGRGLGRLREGGERGRGSAGPAGSVEGIEPVGRVDDVGEESSLSAD